MKNYKKTARRTVARHTAHGIPKSDAKKNGTISSIGTERNYRQSLSNYLEWCDENGVHPDFRANFSTLRQYLEERSEWIQQKSLDLERQALQMIFKQKLPFLRSIRESIYEKRSYTLSQVKVIVVHQNERNAISTWLAFFAGLRAHEAATIMPLYEREFSKNRDWDSKLFIGLPSHMIYTVIGKGGLIRRVAVPQWLSIRLEAKRITSKKVKDREIIYFANYDIGFGQAWSQSFSSASQIALGFSHGGHGLRHSYAKWRLQNLLKHLEIHQQIDLMCFEKQALLILSQELGHFRLDIVYCYLR